VFLSRATRRTLGLNASSLAGSYAMSLRVKSAESQPQWWRADIGSVTNGNRLNEDTLYNGLTFVGDWLIVCKRVERIVSNRVVVLPGKLVMKEVTPDVT
jgi:hypothetical protein